MVGVKIFIHLINVAPYRPTSLVAPLSHVHDGFYYPSCITYIGYTIISIQPLLWFLDHPNLLKTKIKQGMNTMKMPLKTRI